jgi:hypothetical protein
MTIHSTLAVGTAAIVHAFNRGAGSLLITLALTGTNATAQSLSTVASRDLLAMDPGELARLLEGGRPAAAPESYRAAVLSGLPRDGEVHDLSDDARQKLASLAPVLQAARRESVYTIKVIELPSAVVAVHARTVILISRPALEMLSAAELRALVAHETGHEYVWEEYARASERGEKRRLRDLELVCDVIAVMTLRAIGQEPSSLVTAIEKVTLFNRVRLGTADNEDSYPTLAQRRSVALSLGSSVPRER